MLNAKALSEVLTKNSDERLCKRWYLMTPNGTLLAHTQPSDARELRKQVAMVALSWQEHAQIPAEPDEASSQTQRQQDLHTLIIESETGNVVVRRIQPQLLLVLEGGVPPRKPSFEPRVVAEGPEGGPSHDGRSAGSPSTSISSKADSSMSTATAGVLALHRRKLDMMAAAIVAEFDQTGFHMPGEGSNQLF
ncbi:hypothetical protein LTR53_015135 [Teratosphaeriaceae sp. CCFEE 6253]|nr:hypothetical protein LTR53_015135 [Teratosphaeriaceae sp. CCFEE 6253]